MAFDIENFPYSDTAQRMLSYVTNGWYDRSYVGKWLYEIMGIELDDIEDIIDDLPNQLFPETTTWAMKYHEYKYGLDILEHLDIEERRRRVLEKRNLKSPITPWRMEKIIGDATGYDLSVFDLYESPVELPHPNVFLVVVNAASDTDVGKVIKKLRAITQSHVTFQLNMSCDLTIEVHTKPAAYRPSFDLCGTLPDISTGLSIGDGIIDMSLDPKDYMAYQDMSGELDTGEKPIESVQLRKKDESLTFGISGGSTYVQNRMCGEEPIMEV